MRRSGNETFDRDRRHVEEDGAAGAGGRTRKSTPEGEVRTQRGRPDEIDGSLLAHGHEMRDAAVRPIAWALAGVAALVAAAGSAVTLLFGVYGGLESTPSATPLERTVTVPPRPRLELHEGEDRPGLEDAARHRLAATGPVPDEPGRVRIPIEHAMALLARRGWPDPDGGSRPAARPSDTVPPSARVPSGGVR